MMKFKGIMPALVTPLNADDTINVEALKKLLEHFIQDGADGFYIGGATGEGISLSPEVRKVLAEESIATVNGRKPCIIHIASTNFNDAVMLAKHAEKVGADAISAIPPMFFKYDEDDVYNYYKRLADAVSIPLMIYYNPAAGFDINAKFAARMFEVDNITAIKWTSSNYYEMMRLKELTHGEMNIINGPDEMLLMGLNAGADGGIGTTYNFMLPLFLDIYKNFKDKNIEAAQECQFKVARLVSVLKRFSTIPATKVLVEEMGFNVGNAAFPLKRYDDAQKAEIVAAFKEAGWNY